MSNAKLVFDDGAYDRLMQEVVAISNASFAMKDKIPANVKHLHTILDDATHKARRILVDEVAVEGEEPRTHINLDAGPPKKVAEQLGKVFDRCAHDLTDLIREEEEA